MDIEKKSKRLNRQDSEADSSSDSGSESPGYGAASPTYLIPKVIHSNLDDNLQELAQSIYNSNEENTLTNELSAPYEVPQFPIEKNEKKRAIQRQLILIRIN